MVWFAYYFTLGCVLEFVLLLQQLGPDALKGERRPLWEIFLRISGMALIWPWWSPFVVAYEWSKFVDRREDARITKALAARRAQDKPE